MNKGEMIKLEDEFCDLCGHRLYKFPQPEVTLLWCEECGTFVSPENAAPPKQVRQLRAKFDAKVEPAPLHEINPKVNHANL